MKSIIILMSFLFSTLLFSQQTFNSYYYLKENGKLDFKNNSYESLSKEVPTKTSISLIKKQDQFVFIIVEENNKGEYIDEEWTVTQYTINKTNSSMKLKVSNERGDIKVVTWLKDVAIFFINYDGIGVKYIEKPKGNLEDLTKEVYDVIASDGMSYYYYNQDFNTDGWFSDLNDEDEEQDQLLYITPSKESYRIRDTLDTRHYDFKNEQAFSSIFSKNVIQKKNIDNIYTLYKNFLKDEKDKKEIRYKCFYPENIELISWKAECPTCKNENWQVWETLKGLLMFTCNETSQVDLEIKYKIKIESDKIKVDKIKVEEPPKITAEKIINKETFETIDNIVTVTVFDDASVDGDIISIKLNDKILINKLVLNKCKASFEVYLVPGKNILTLIAENVGKIPPNTAAFEISGKNIKKAIVLRADYNYSESITIISN